VSSPVAWRRLPLLALGMLALVTGVLTGLARMGWPVPLASLLLWHGPLMLSGLFGVVIALERAVAVGHRAAYLAPLATGLGTLALLLGAPAITLPLYTAGGLGLLVLTLLAAARQREAFMLPLLAGALCAAVGPALLAAGRPWHEALLPLLAFPVLTIAGERLELSRYVPRPRWAQAAAAGIILLLLLATLAAPLQGITDQVFGLGLALLALWLLAFDLARRTWRAPGLTGFVALALLSGYLQLLMAGTVMLLWGLGPGSAAYDAALHLLGLGFVFSMVFGHAPLIAPALLRLRKPLYSAWLYLPLALLHGSVLMRGLAGLVGEPGWRQASGLGSALSLGLFLVLMLWRA
jgi:hypothetical protein